MRILVVPSTYDFQNLGEIAMLQVAVRRLSSLFPGSSIEVLTSAPALLAQHCPGASPVLYEGWFQEHYLLGRLHRSLPHAVSASLENLRRWVRRTMPAAEAAAVRWKRRRLGLDASAYDDFRGALEHVDGLAVSGLGGISDVFPASSALCLDMVELGLQRGIPVAIFGHGFGPLRDRKLLAWVMRVLPRVRVIALREGLHGPAVLKSVGVPPERFVVTGDDAIEVAYEGRSPRLGGGIGINVRLGERSGVAESDLERIRPIVQAASRRLRAPLVPVPIARQHQLDAAAIRRLMEGLEATVEYEIDLDSPARLVKQMGQCRILITGAYHAAVFALAQGIPTICLVNTEYFSGKFNGLAGMFGSGCELVSLGTPDWQERLREVIEGVYGSAEDTRHLLLLRAERQIQMGRTAYERFQQVVQGERAAA